MYNAGKSKDSPASVKSKIQFTSPASVKSKIRFMSIRNNEIAMKAATHMHYAALQYALLDCDSCVTKDIIWLPYGLPILE